MIFLTLTCIFSSTAVWNDWRRSRTCWSRHTDTSSTWPSWTTISTKRSPSWKPRSSACTRHLNGCPFLGSTDSGLRRFVRSPPWTATARRGWSSDRRHHNGHRLAIQPLVAKIWWRRRQLPASDRNAPRAVMSDQSDIYQKNVLDVDRLDGETIDRSACTIWWPCVHEVLSISLRSCYQSRDTRGN